MKIRTFTIGTLVALLALASAAPAFATDPSPVYKRAISCIVPENAPTAGGFKFDLFGSADLTGTAATDVLYATGGLAPTLVNSPDGSLELLITANVEVVTAANSSRQLVFTFIIPGYDAILKYDTVAKTATLSVGDSKAFAVTCKPLLRV